MMTMVVGSEEGFVAVQGASTTVMTMGLAVDEGAGQKGDDDKSDCH